MRSWLRKHPLLGRFWPALGLIAALLASSAPASGAPADEPTAEVANNATVFYHTGTRDWSAYYLHYAPTGGAWTTVPGVAMEAACDGWVKRAVDLGDATGFQATFTDGSGTWDNNDGANYQLGAGPIAVRDGQVSVSDPCGAAPDPDPNPDPDQNQARIYFSTATLGWRTVNLHYRPDGGSWTAVPGVGMTEACPGWVTRTVDLGAATELTAAFNNGSGTWDNNNGADYRIGTGLTTVADRRVVPDATDPCAGHEPDTEAPTTPTGLTAEVNGVGVVVKWDASTDNVGVTGYQVTLAGGPGGTAVADTTSTVWSRSGLEPRTDYAFSVRARDAAGNLSAPTAPVEVTTGEAPPAPAAGEPIGTDPREDPIYFVLTARFFDGDSSNNRGGSQHERSGNASYDDPMFRGDFKGLVEKLDYIKALGFSAVWITPVVLNRSDYDYHGYHGWDFYRVDPRLESTGATYQDLINAAHAMDMKIYQDVVYNHSSRWGANGLYTPTVYGVQDEQWDWYYDTPEAGREYDPLEEDAEGRPYNGDLWSTDEPTGNTCVNWGQPTGSTSPEGYRIYHCQWPSPTSGMFPEEYYHQCWIGNWEGEDSRSCWLHDDLADLNTENAEVQDHLINAYNRFIDMGVDGFRVDTAVHIPRIMWTRHFLPAIHERVEERFGAEKAENFFVFGEVAAFVNDKWNRGSVNHSAQFFTWQPRQEYSADDAEAVLEEYEHENGLGTGGQPTSDNAFLDGNAYHAPDRGRFSGMNIIDMRMHMNFGDAANAFHNGRDSDDSVNDATYNVVYVDSHDYGPNKSSTRYAGGTDAWAENMALMWTFRGIPTLYYGSEIEFQAGQRIDCGPTCPLATTGRAYYGDHVEGEVTAGDFGEVESASGAVAETLEQPLVRHVQRLNQIRHAIPALQKGQYSTEGVDGHMAFKRRYTDTAAGVDSMALVTVTHAATFTGVPNGTWTDAVTGDTVQVTNGTLAVDAPGQGNLRAYVLDTELTPAPGVIGAAGPYLH
ncbi:carbohydrate binding domain-containing protein [Streptomyces radicis]|uniref:Alpha-amylase n=1 Tax=Streptomyces radicis TaxID=1750517 RepID=A0A3A9WJQ0_9ACTN|nr:carbohydrate binding domain-containing protein [Streptomyces radicis]RKN06327.1 alpha-amylase [Streptomyces radicis]RKN18657.1 alpha-amylase [Streptomyces radicis]